MSDMINVVGEIFEDVSEHVVIIWMCEIDTEVI